MMPAAALHGSAGRRSGDPAAGQTAGTCCPCLTPEASSDQASVASIVV